jgi:hypothetical protein
MLRGKTAAAYAWNHPIKGYSCRQATYKIKTHARTHTRRAAAAPNQHRGLAYVYRRRIADRVERINTQRGVRVCSWMAGDCSCHK